MLFWIVLTVVNVPLALVIGWALFDSANSAADTIWDTLLAVLKIILVPRLVRELLGMDTSDAVGLFPIVCFFGGCAAGVFGELYFLDWLWPSIVPWPESGP